MEAQLFGVLGRFTSRELNTFSGALFDWSDVNLRRSIRGYDPVPVIQYRFMVSNGDIVELSPIFEHSFRRPAHIAWIGNGLVKVDATVRWYPFSQVWPESKLLRDADGLGLPQFVG